MRQLEASNTLCDSTGEGAFLVAEKFALQQAGWDSSTIQFHKGVRAARAEIMNRTRDQFLACSGLPVNQHRGTGRGNGLDLVEDGTKGFAMADDLFEAVLGSDFVFKIQLLLRELVLEVGDLAIGEGIVHRDRHLVCDLGKKLGVFPREGILLSPGEAHNAQHATSAGEWEETEGVHTLSDGCALC